MCRVGEDMLLSRCIVVLKDLKQSSCLSMESESNIEEILMVFQRQLCVFCVTHLDLTLMSFDWDLARNYRPTEGSC